MKLAAKLMMIFLLAALPMMTMSSYLTVQRDLRRFAQAQEQKVLAIANDIQTAVVQSYQQGGLSGLVKALQNFTTPLPPLEVRWVWFDEEPYAPMGPRVPIDRIQDAVYSGKLVSVSSRGLDGEGLLLTYFPLSVGRSRAGGIEVSGSLAEFERGRTETIYNTLLFVGGMALMCVLIVIGAGIQLVGKPLSKLIRKTKRIGRGELDEPLSLPGRDELSELAIALNEMAHQLGEQQRAIASETSKRQETQEQLRHADRLKTVGRLAAGIAHELGTPLNVISGRAALIASGKLPGEDVARSAATIKGEADRITGIIRQLLDFARQNKPQRAPMDVRNVAEHTLDLVDAIASKADVEIRLVADSDPYMAIIDPGQMQQVLTNLVVNGIQAVDQDGVVTIELSRTVGKDGTSPFVQLAVVDNGCGIDPEHLEQLFEPFFTTKEVGEGTGLGLSIVFGIVEEHGGWVDVQSEPGRGSRFEIYLPTGD